MSAPRFYCPPPLPQNADAELPPEAAHHASRVLRLRVGDAVQIFDGLGNALDASISAIEGKHVILGNLHTYRGQPEPGLRIVLAQAMCTSDKMDWVVQKATELGAAEIVPVQTQRSVAKLSGPRAEKRAEHWRNVTVSACEQCGRNTLPQLHAPQELATWLNEMRHVAGQLNSSCCRAAPAICKHNPDRKTESPCSSARKAASPRTRPTSRNKPGSFPSCSARACCAPRPQPSPASPHCRRYGAISSEFLKGSACLTSEVGDE